MEQIEFGSDKMECKNNNSVTFWYFCFESLTHVIGKTQATLHCQHILQLFEKILL